MPIDLTGPRQAAAIYLMPDTYTIQRGATTLTGSCGFAAASGRTEEDGARMQQRGSYRMRVRVDADIRPNDRPQIFGRTFRIVWTPPAHGLSLFRMLGLEEVGSGA